MPTVGDQIRETCEHAKKRRDVKRQSEALTRTAEVLGVQLLAEHEDTKETEESDGWPGQCLYWRLVSS